MKKIPTLFERLYKDHKVVGITDHVTPGCEGALDGTLRPTVKYDGSCCAIINGKLYKRYDAKKGKKPPEGAIPCCDPDPVTGHWPHWVLCDKNKPEDRWYFAAYEEDLYDRLDGTYEAVGPHFQGNPYNLPCDRLLRHGDITIFELDMKSGLSFDYLREFLRRNKIEGIVWWSESPAEPVCKLKRTDFGFEWPIRKEQNNEID